MVVVSILFHAGFGPNDHREDAPQFRFRIFFSTKISGFVSLRPLVRLSLGGGVYIRERTL